MFNCVLFIGGDADLFLSQVPFFVGIDAEIEKSKTMSKPSCELKGFPCDGIAEISCLYCSDTVCDDQAKAFVTQKV